MKKNHFGILHSAKPHNQEVFLDLIPTMETALKQVLTGATAVDALVVTYDETDTYMGGNKIVVRGNGPCESCDWTRFSSEKVKGWASPEDIRDLAALLLEHKIWEQYRPRRLPFRDEPTSVLVVEVGDLKARCWELYQDRTRLNIIQSRMSALVTGRV